MSANPFRLVLHSVRQRLGLDASAASPDALLLERFVLVGDESAFAALVERHGAMVWGVCQRVAGDAHAAEDAFQATWIVLSRKADSVKDGGVLPGWLHRVAYRLSLAARLRPAAPLEDAPVGATGPEDEAALGEVRRVIDEEVSRLPEKYRLPVVLCFLEGRTHAEAAAALGWPIGTVAGRVARAKDLLHARLTRRGLAPAALLLALAAAGAFPPVAVKAAGAGAVSLAAALLAGEAQRRWLVGAALLLLACAGVAAGVAVYSSTSPGDPGGQSAIPIPTPPEDEPSLAARIPRTRIQVDGDVALSPDGKWMAGSRDGRVRLFDVRTNEEVRTLAGDLQGRASYLLFSPDGQWLAASGDFNNQSCIKVWNLASGEEKSMKDLTRPDLTGELQRPAASLLFSPDGQWLAASGSLGIDVDWIKVWNLASGEGKSMKDPTLPDSVGSQLVGFVPGSDQLVIAGRQTWGGANGMRPWYEMHLWDVRSGNRMRSFRGARGSLSPDGQTLAAWDPTGATWLWEVSSGKGIQLESDDMGSAPRGSRSNGSADQRGFIGVPTFHPDSETVATFGRLGFVRLWDRKTGRLQATLDPYQATLDPYVAPYGQICPVNPVPPLHGIEYWEHEGEWRWVLPHAVFSPDGETLACPFKGMTLLWSVSNRKFLFKLEGPLRSFSPDGKKLATGVNGLPSPLVRTKLWDVASGKLVCEMDGGESFFPDSKTLYSRPKRLPPGSPRLLDGPRFWDARTGREHGAFNGYGGGGLAFTLDSKTLVSVSGGKAAFWDMTTAVKTDVPGKATVAPDGTSVAFENGSAIKLHFSLVSPDGKLQVELFAETPPETAPEELHPKFVNGPGATVKRSKGEAQREGGPEGEYCGVVAAAFSPDGKYLALGREDGTILLWDISPTR